MSRPAPARPTGGALREPARQGGRYLLTGGIGWVVDFLTYVALLGPLGVFWAQSAARVVGALVTFVGHKLFVFRDHRTEAVLVARQTLQYVVLWVLSYLLSLGGILFLVGQQMHPVLAKILVEVLVVLLNFLTMKRLIFAGDPR